MTFTCKECGAVKPESDECHGGRCHDCAGCDDEERTAILDDVRPPLFVIELAVVAAMRSPCAKSKRGVVLYDAEEAARWAKYPDVVQQQHAVPDLMGGFNGPPGTFVCTGNDGVLGAACRQACGSVCVHAEERAIRNVGALDDVAGLDLVHVKAVDGKLVATGGPSCVTCSRTILDAGVRGVWLFETYHDERTTCRWIGCRIADCDMCQGRICATHHVSDCGCDELGRHASVEPRPPVWRYYTAHEFHAVSLGDPKNKLPSFFLPLAP